MRPAAATAVLGLALAVGVPTAWNLTRPTATAGAPVEETLGTPSASSSPVPAPTAPRSLPTVSTRPATPVEQETGPAPVRLSAPALGVDSVVDPVGVEPDGQMTLPADVARVGWYRFGPAPGDEGSAVIARQDGKVAVAPRLALKPLARGTVPHEHQPSAGAPLHIRPAGQQEIELLLSGGKGATRFESDVFNGVLMSKISLRP